MKPLLPLALLLVAPTLLDVCDACKKGKLCKPHAELESAEIERLRPELQSDENRDRIGALREVAALTRAHDNVRSEKVAKVLVAALADRSLRVRDRAVRLLVDRQHPETTVVALVGLMEGFKKNMWSLVAWLMGRGEEHGTTADAMKYLETVMRVSGGVRDDRVAEALAAVLMAMPTEMRGQPVAMAATKSLLELGTRDAVRTVMRQFDTLPYGREMRNVHDALGSFALDLELEDYPEYDASAPKAWKRWFKKHSRAMPAKLGAFSEGP